MFLRVTAKGPEYPNLFRVVHLNNRVTGVTNFLLTLDITLRRATQTIALGFKRTLVFTIFRLWRRSRVAQILGVSSAVNWVLVDIISAVKAGTRDL